MQKNAKIVSTKDMDTSTSTQEQPKKPIAAGAGIALIVVSAFLVLASSTDSYRVGFQTAFQGDLPSDLREPLDASEPVRLRIPDIAVDTSFVSLGIDDAGEIETPEGFDEVGWYTHGPTPGEMGPSIILGHVDSYTGPAVFFSLGQLEDGDLIHVDREDGTTATFRVTKLERYYRNGFPTDMVYGNIDHAGLRLITCSGSFDHANQEYSKVLVVYAALVDGAEAQ